MEIDILNAIQIIFKCEFLDFVMPLITRIGDYGIFWIILSVIFFTTKKYRKIGVTMIAALLMTLIVCNLTIKPLIARPRPFTINPVELLIPPPNDFSFPSGHTLASFTAGFSILFYDRIKGVLALILAFLIAFSRLYLYVHYPTDVLAAIVLAFLFAFLSYLLIKELYKIKNHNNLL